MRRAAPVSHSGLAWLRGAQVVGVDKNLNGAEEKFGSMLAEGAADSLIIAADVADAGVTREVADDVVDHWGGIDIDIAVCTADCAGHRSSYASVLAREEWLRAYVLNVLPFWS